MARRAFHDPGVLQQLNAIVHRAVEQKRDGFLAAHRQDPVVILDAPLLLECGWEKVTDTVWLVYLPEEEQIRRAMIRSGMTREEVTDRIRKQMSLEEKKKKAQVVLDNQGSLEALYRQVDRELARILP